MTPFSINGEADNETDASDFFSEHLNNILKYSNKSFYMRINNIWTNDETEINNLLLFYVLSADIEKPIGDKLYPFSKNYSTAEKIVKAILVKFRINGVDNSLHHKFRSTCIGKICFKDGVLDFINNKFYLWKYVDFEYYSLIMIDREFFDAFRNPNNAVINEIKTKLFEPLFGDKLDIALQMLSRAIAGHYTDKKWCKYIGNRDCGKGVIDVGLTYTFEKYIGHTSANNLLCQRIAGENARNYSWLIPLEFNRIIIMQECENKDQTSILNGELIKKMSGGSDTFKVRRLYQDEQEISLEGLPILFGNEDYNIKPIDALSSCIEFCTTIQFKPKSFIDKLNAELVDNENRELIMSQYREADADIKDKCKTDEWKNAIIHLLLQSYKNKKVDDFIDDTDNNKSFKMLFLETFLITKNDNDFVSNTELNDWLDEIDYKISDKKRSGELKSLGAKLTNISGKNRGFLFIKRKC